MKEVNEKQGGERGKEIGRGERERTRIRVEYGKRKRKSELVRENVEGRKGGR